MECARVKLHEKLESTINWIFKKILLVMVLLVHVKFIPQNNYSPLNITQHYGNYPRFHAGFQRAGQEKNEIL